MVNDLPLILTSVQNLGASLNLTGLDEMQRSWSLIITG